MASRWYSLFLGYLSKPAGDRPIYRTICKERWSRFMEISIHDTLRARRMIALAGRFRPLTEIEYVGIDLFEARQVPPGTVDGATIKMPALNLKDVHRDLRATGAVIRLVPGDPFSALARKANELRGLDLVVVSADVDLVSLERAWFYLPRVLHDRSRVFLMQPGEKGAIGKWLNRSEVDALAAAANPKARRAA